MKPLASCRPARHPARPLPKPADLPQIAIRPDDPEPCSLKALPVVGDHMAPTLLDGDHVLYAPVRSFRGIGLYVIRFASRDEYAVCRVERVRDRRLRLSRDNPKTGGRCEVMSLTTFVGLVVGKVAARLSPLDRALFRNAFFS